MIKIWTDGSCLKNPGGAGGWAFRIEMQKKLVEISGHCPSTTNNRMELKAIVEALKVLKSGREVTLYSDSRYCIDGATSWMKAWKENGWKRKTKQPQGGKMMDWVVNVDLWAELDEQLQRMHVEFKWVKGHSGNAGNVRVDHLALHAAHGRVTRRIE